MADASIDPGDLPRLLYVADVPVENSLHGSSLLYRLLLHYPKDRLKIVETGMHASLPERRLPGVEYRFVPQRFERLRRTRLTKWVESAAMLTARVRTRSVRRAAAGFAADAVLTVTHGNVWLSAVALATELGIPYHFICHDEWARTQLTLAPLDAWKERAFARSYRGAASRLCVSPAMTEDYAVRYGAPGATLYPARSYDAEIYADLSPRMADGAGGRVFAFAGSMNTVGMVAANVRLAEGLARSGGKLVVFGPASVAAHPELDRPNIELRGLLPPDALATALRTEVDALFLPMWSEPQYADNMRLSFPSKLTEYTNVGLPILITGPDYCSAARWEREFPGVAAVVTTEDAEDLQAAAEHILADRAYAKALAERAQVVGATLFAPEAAERIFGQALRDGESRGSMRA